jgi:hypothetical protein
MFDKPPKLYRSQRRSVARKIIWTAFAIIVFVRFVALRGWFNEAQRERHQFAQFQFDDNRRFRRPPTRVRTAVAEVPKDLWRIEIEVPRKDADIFRNYYWHRNGNDDRPEASVTIREGGVTYTNVTLHLKGSAGSFRPYDDKPAMTLNFSKNAPHQKFHGYSKISLNNSVQDPSFLSEQICRELFEAAGVPAAHAGHATVVLDGRDLGLYVYTEGFGKPFLKRYFKDVSGNLYDGGFCQEITQPLDVNSGDHPEDRSDLNRLALAAGNRGPDHWQRLTNSLDIDEFVRFLAMEAITCHWDGYSRNRNNYRVFHNAATDKMIFIPHGMDQMFGVMRARPDDPIESGMSGLVARAVVSTPQGRKMYLDRIAYLRTNVFDETRVLNRVQELSDQLRPTLAAYGENTVREHEFYVRDLKERIAQRAQSITQQLDHPRLPAVAEFDKSGVLRVPSWSSWVTAQNGGSIRLGQKRVDGNTLLNIHASGPGTGSWRARVNLPPGSYHFRGRAKMENARGRGGVCLRISGSKSRMEQPEDGSWVDLEFPIEIEGGLGVVELVCEFQSMGGDAWFDQDSLQVIQR